MADEPKKDHPEDIESILSDLDAILTDMGGEAPAAPAPAEVAKVPPKPVEIPKPAEAPKPVAPIPVKAEVPPPPPPQAAQVVIDSPKANQPPPPIEAPKPIQPIIELAPREGMIKPPEKKPEPAKPAAKLPDQKPIDITASPSTPVEAPKAAAPIDPPKANQPVAAPAPAPIAAPIAAEPFPADAPKEQVRRVAYVCTSSCSEVKMAFAAFLSQSARTISKKPLFLREVLAHEVAAASDPNAVLQKALQVKACAILAIVDGWPSAKVDELSEACSRANLLFRAVAPADAQKKSTAVDIIVDMMLLPGEG